MKIFLIYDEGPSESHHKLAITLPAKWLEQSADKVKELFVERYNKKFPDNLLDDEELEMIVILRMNRKFMQFMRANYNHLTNDHFGFTVVSDDPMMVD